jgi:hypothetical protein
MSSYPNSNSKKPAASSREAEVLERQRQMANRISVRKAITTSSKPPPPPMPPSKNNGTASSSVHKQPLAKATTRNLASLMGGGKPSAPREPPAPIRTTTAVTAKNGSAENPICLGEEDVPNAQKPTALKRPKPRVNTAEMALAQSRQRAGVVATTVDGSKQSEMATTSNSSRASSSDGTNSNKLKRPSMRRTPSAAGGVTATLSTSKPVVPTTTNTTNRGGGGSLSSLLLSNTNTAKYLQPNAPKLLKHYNKIEPNDYWKNMREWDFLGEMNERMMSQRQNSGAAAAAAGGSGGKRKRDKSGGQAKVEGSSTSSTQRPKQHAPLPDTFQSYREYCALWAPLCLEEARAQLLSDAITEIPYWKSKPEKNPLRVTLLPLKKDLDGSSENMGVQVKKVLTPDFMDRSFIANDVVLLVKSESLLWDATKGTLGDIKQQSTSSSTIVGVIGNIEHTRRSVDGLVIQVSRNLWSQIASHEMILLKVGCNITSLREFTALCRMDSIPLLEYILGTKMNYAANETAEKGLTIEDNDVDSSPEKEKQAKKEILEDIGGAEALGKGFAEYASHKFNLSQLKAIASSAHEYGGGGFTLIKGPPGTVSTIT